MTSRLLSRALYLGQVGWLPLESGLTKPAPANVETTYQPLLTKLLLQVEIYSPINARDIQDKLVGRESVCQVGRYKKALGGDPPAQRREVSSFGRSCSGRSRQPSMPRPC